MADQLWCCECYADDAIAVAATHKVFDDDVCKRHFDILSKEIADIQNPERVKATPTISPTKRKEPVTPLEPQTTKRPCGRVGCSTLVGPSNKSGYCGSHVGDSRKKWELYT
jgi:hypothetical protein